MIGRVLKGFYKVYDQVGSGGLATVYLARNLRTNQIVAVKVLRAEAAADPEMRVRFDREADLLAGLEGAHFVRLIDHGIEDSQPFLVMEFVEGTTLKDAIRERGAFSAQDALGIGRQVAEGLAALHDKGVIHRDIKPQNIMIKPDGSVKVMDFGIAKVANLSSVTHSGFMVGTPHYISPEQALGQPVDQRADIYSLGVVLFEMLTGKVLFDAESPLSVLLKHVQDPVPDDWVQQYHVSPEAAGVAEQCLRKNPADRYQRAQDLIAAIDVALGNLPAEVSAGMKAGIALQGQGESPAVAYSAKTEWRSSVTLEPQGERMMEHPPQVFMPAQAYSSPVPFPVIGASLPLEERPFPWVTVLLAAGSVFCLAIVALGAALFLMNGSRSSGSLSFPFSPIASRPFTPVIGSLPRPTSTPQPTFLRLSATPVVIIPVITEGKTMVLPTVTLAPTMNQDKGLITLQVLPVERGLGTVVQWQDSQGDWNDVDGWRSVLREETQSWEVYRPEFGKGPFRWVVYRERTGELAGVSKPFFLPRNGGATVRVQVRLQPFAMPLVTGLPR